MKKKIFNELVEYINKTKRFSLCKDEKMQINEITYNLLQDDIYKEYMGVHAREYIRIKSIEYRELKYRASILNDVASNLKKLEDSSYNRYEAEYECFKNKYLNIYNSINVVVKSTFKNKEEYQEK